MCMLLQAPCSLQARGAAKGGWGGARCRITFSSAGCVLLPVVMVRCAQRYGVVNFRFMLQFEQIYGVYCAIDNLPRIIPLRGSQTLHTNAPITRIRAVRPHKHGWIVPKFIKKYTTTAVVPCGQQCMKQSG